MGNEFYCGITGHWIDDDWKMQYAALECVHVEERHYAATVAQVYETFAADWGITTKLMAVVTDNARNMTANVAQVNETFAADWGITTKLMAVVTDNARNMTADVAKPVFQHIPCLAHTLQLSILAGFKEADTNSLFAKCRKVVGHFKHSAANTSELENCNDSDSPLHKLQQDVPTRWNSICIMMKSMLQAKNAMIAYMAAPCSKSFKGAKLLDSDWEKCRNMLKSWNCFVKLLSCLVVTSMFLAAVFFLYCHH